MGEATLTKYATSRLGVGNADKNAAKAIAKSASLVGEATLTKYATSWLGVGNADKNATKATTQRVEE